MRHDIIQGDCLDLIRSLPSASVDAIITDPPYFRVKRECEWDNKWDDRAQFIDWLAGLSDEWKRVLKPNGSLMCFASPQLASHVELMLGERFTVLNHIVWHKGGGSSGTHKRACKDALRSFFPATERIVFCEQKGADRTAINGGGYARKCDEARGFIFSPLRDYMAGELERSGISRRDVDAAWRTAKGNKGGMASHWFGYSQWALPTMENYEWLRGLLNASGGEFLRKDYEELRKDYEELRRPFSVSPESEYTDVWRFAAVQGYKGKHPCEKPGDMMRHAVASTTKPGALVLDCFAGSGATGAACAKTGRDFIGFEIDHHWCDYARATIASALSTGLNVPA